MQAVKRIDIVVDALEADHVLSLLSEAGVSSYTMVRLVEGAGERGLRRGDELTGVMQNSYIMVACAPHLVGPIVESLRPILTRFGGICLVSDAQWIIH